MTFCQPKKSLLYKILISYAIAFLYTLVAHQSVSIVRGTITQNAISVSELPITPFANCLDASTV